MSSPQKPRSTTRPTRKRKTEWTSEEFDPVLLDIDPSCPTLDEAQAEMSPKHSTEFRDHPEASSRTGPWFATEEPTAPIPIPGQEGIPPVAQSQDIGIALMPTIMADALTMDSKGYSAVVNRVHADAGAPTDPIEIMMIEQLVLMHFRAAQFQRDAGQAQGVTAIHALNSASARLLREFRRHALALQAYRAGRQKSSPPAEGGGSR